MNWLMAYRRGFLALLANGWILFIEVPRRDLPGNQAS